MSDKEYILYLPVKIETGEVDYMWVEYEVTDLTAANENPLVSGWEWRKFKIVPADQEQ